MTQTELQQKWLGVIRGTNPVTSYGNARIKLIRNLIVDQARMDHGLFFTRWSERIDDSDPDSVATISEFLCDVRAVVGQATS